MVTIRQTTIPELPATASLDGTELVPISQGGVTRTATATQLATLIGGEAAVGPQGPQGPQGPIGPTGPQGPQGTPGPAGTGITYKGTWNSATSYVLSDLVTYNGSGWIAKASNTNVTPAENASWTLFVQQGAPGPTGPTGPTGPQGPAGSNGAAATVNVGTVTTGAAGSSASVTNVGTSSAAIFNFTIPRGDTGAGGVTTTYVDTGDTNTLNSAKAYADTVGGGSGTYSLPGGGTKPELAAAFGTWTLSGTTAPTQNSTQVIFSGASNIAAASKATTLKDNQSYDINFTVSGYSSGAVRVLLYGATSAHAGVTPSVSANGTYSYTVTTSAAGSNNNEIRVQATGASNNTFTISGLSVKESGGASLTRPANDKMTEIEVSVVDYGADNTGVSDATAAFNNAIASGAKRIHVPAGTYKVTNLVFNKNIEFFGDGRGNSIINITTTTTHGVDIVGDSSAPAERVVIIRDVKFNYTGTGQAANKVGVWVRRKVFMTNVSIRGFTWHGIYFSPLDATAATNAAGTKGTIGNAVFFARFDNVWSKYNGGDGCVVRMGANANTFINCDFSNNVGVGFHHLNDGTDDNGNNGSTYGNTILTGQASYNGGVGYYFESGTNITTTGLYAELNNNPTQSTPGYVGTVPTKDYDFYVGDNCLRSWIGIGVLYNASTIHVRVPGFNSNVIQIWEGGRRIFGDT